MNYLHAHILLDRSGSMISHVDQTISSVNEYIGSLRADAATETRISLSMFDAIDDHNHRKMMLDHTIDARPIRSVVPITRADYVPRGWTPLYDAIGQTVPRMRGMPALANERNALVIVTDGLENSSREFKASDVRALLESVQKDGWLVIYLGADHDAMMAAGSVGVQMGHTMSFDKDNVRHSMNAASRATRSYAFSGQVEDAYFTDDERKRAKDE